jgi:signal transduction histidine kinase
VFDWPGIYILTAQWLSLVELITWQNLATGLLAFVALLHCSRWEKPLRDVAFGLALTYGFYFFITFDQGHGWGSRYGHAVLGNLVLLAVAGARALRDEVGMVLLRRLLIGATAFALFVQFPLRGWQVERFVRPFAQATAAVQQLPAEIVVIDPKDAWYAQDLVRNDPFLTNRPLVLNALKLTEAEQDALRRRPGVRFLRREELHELGLWQRAAP